MFFLRLLNTLCRAKYIRLHSFSVRRDCDGQYKFCVLCRSTSLFKVKAVVVGAYKLGLFGQIQRWLQFLFVTDEGDTLGILDTGPTT